MRFLIDTHTFLWFVGGDARLTAAARHLINDAGNEILLSVASVWEIAIKVSIGKLDLPKPIAPFILGELASQQIGLLPISVEHALSVSVLPQHHRDPFDRMIVVQSLTENLPVVSADAKLDAYGVLRHW